jgi:hypothetical protein
LRKKKKEKLRVERKRVFRLNHGSTPWPPVLSRWISAEPELEHWK